MVFSILILSGSPIRHYFLTLHDTGSCSIICHLKRQKDVWSSVCFMHTAALVFCLRSQSGILGRPCVVRMTIGIPPSCCPYQVPLGRRMVPSRVSRLSFVLDDFWWSGVRTHWRGIDFVIIMKNFGNIMKNFGNILKKTVSHKKPESFWLALGMGTGKITRH